MNLRPETSTASHPHADLRELADARAAAIAERRAAMPAPATGEPIGLPSWRDGPDEAAIRQALDLILSSPVFARSERLRSFLAYVVEKDMAGEAHQLKGYTIGIDVFHRPEHFNADNDPLVRVHAGKLRKHLAAYYETEGREAIWRIDIPKGSYAPVYRRSYSPGEACPVSFRHIEPDDAPATTVKPGRPAQNRRSDDIGCRRPSPRRWPLSRWCRCFCSFR